MTKYKVKIVISNYGNKDELIESLWAEKVEDGVYKLLNSPFYAYGYSYNDLVKVIENENELVVKEVYKRGGHSTFRIMISDSLSNDVFLTYWNKLEEEGCTYEKAGEKLFSIDVLPNHNIDNVISSLKKGESNGVWEYEEGYVFNG